MFNEALAEYNKAIQKDPNNLLFENNRAGLFYVNNVDNLLAVYLELGNYEKCIEICEAAIERRYDVKADFVVVAKV